jgi:DNA (cytosine-5)-methyltransferase 1
VGKLGFVSLFSGGMGLDLGLKEAGFTPLVCNEIDTSAVKTIRYNSPALPVISKSITDISASDLERESGKSLSNLPLVVGGPPCQSFSVYGKRKGVEDVRGQLIYEFVRIISELRPKAFLMENVRGLHSMSALPKSAANTGVSKSAKLAEHGSLLREIIKRFEDVGYRIDCFLVNVVNYGGPQIRERLICIGNRYNISANFPEPQYSNRPEDRLPQFRTLGDVIGSGYVESDADCMNFSPRKLQYLSMVPSGGNWRSLPIEVQKESMGKAWHLKGGRSAYWRKLSFEFPSPTVVTMPNHAGTSMCHPTELRALTVGELAAIQEFPPTWKFQGTATEKCRQIGNAVPVRLGSVAGSVIKDLLSRISTAKEVGTSVPSRVVHIRPHVRTRTFWKAGQAFAGGKSYYDEEDVEEVQQPTLFD